MKIIGLEVLDQFKKDYPDAKKQTDIWLAEVDKASWTMFSDIKEKYRSADYVRPDNVVFNIKGNHYRIWIRINFIKGIVLVEKAGTHKEYNEWDIS